MASENLYRRLQQHLDHGPVGFPATQSGVELRILEQMFTPEEAGIALELSTIPEPAATVHKRLKDKWELDKLEEALERMDDRGLLLRIERHGREPLYAKLMFAVGMYERQLNRLTPELQRNVDRYGSEAFGKAFHTKKTTQMRIVPVNREIAASRDVGTYQDIRAHVEASQGPFAKMDCICRKGSEMLGKPCRQTTLRDNCLMIGEAARWTSAHLGAPMITRQEMLELLDEADRQGLVLETENTQSPLFICCCCHCCCGVLTSAQQLDKPAAYFTSNYSAAIDAALCQNCGTCSERCQMNAIEVNGETKVDNDRCIGCALCVSTCPSGAMHLEKKAVVREPPRNTQALYTQMLLDRYGRLGMTKAVAQKFLGHKV